MRRDTWLAWLILTSVALGAICCTHLESGSDRFAARATTSAAGSSGSGAGTSSSGGSEQPVGTAGAPTLNNEAGAGGSFDCFDEDGFDGKGCYRCAATDVVSLENTCTSSQCVLFDNQLRVPRVEAGQLPALPAPSSGGTGGGGTGGGGNGGKAGAGGAGGTGNVACDSLAAEGTVIYVTGSTAAKPFLQQIAQQLSGQKVFVVYTSVGSCTGVDAIVNSTLMKTGAAPLPASATYWDSIASTGKACDLPAQGVAADLGISDVFAPSCPGFELANLEALKIRDAHGPIQTMTFAVPGNSRHRQISQQAAYMVWGFGRDGQVLDAAGQQAVWGDESMLLQRSATSGTQVMLAAAIGVPPGRWKGKSNKTSDDVANALQAATATQASADATLGIIGTDYIDSKSLRAQIRVLAYQDSNQACAVTPDSTDTASDKRNVRDGHYPIWGPLHLLYKVDGKGDPQNASIRDGLIDMIGYLSGTKAFSNGLSLLEVYAQSGLVPECAMRVSRNADGGVITPSKPANPCSCRFEELAVGSTSCTKCSVQGGCTGGKTCSFGYCEDP